MTKILIIGGGAMGSAFTVPCLENKNKVLKKYLQLINKNKKNILRENAKDIDFDF